MPRPHLQRAATVRREKVQLPIAEQNFGKVYATTTRDRGAAFTLVKLE
jgi:hypothetical protein